MDRLAIKKDYRAYGANITTLQDKFCDWGALRNLPRSPAEKKAFEIFLRESLVDYDIVFAAEFLSVAMLHNAGFDLSRVVCLNLEGADFIRHGQIKDFPIECLLHCAFFIAPSKERADDLQKYLGANLDFEYLPVSLRPVELKGRSHCDELNIIYSGYFAEWAGLLEFLDAYRKSGAYEYSSLLLQGHSIGTDGYLEAVRKAAEIVPRLKIDTSFYEDKDHMDLLAKQDVGVAFYKNLEGTENFTNLIFSSGKIASYLWSGLAVLTNVEAPETKDPPFIYVRDFSEHEIKQGLRYVRDNRKLFRDSAYELASKKYNFDTCIKRIVERVSKLCENRLHATPTGNSISLLSNTPKEHDIVPDDRKPLPDYERYKVENQINPMAEQTKKTLRVQQQYACLLRKRTSQLRPVTARSNSQIEDTWVEYRNCIRQMILNEDVTNFLNWDIIVGTMFHEAKIQELQFLQSLPDWSRWQKAVRESSVGNPKRYDAYRKSSGNLIHHAYSLAQLEQKGGCRIHELTEIVEFGGGYGSMCRLAYQLGFTGRYIIYDLPELSVLQEYFLNCIGLGNYISYCDNFDAHTSIVLLSDLDKMDEELNCKTTGYAFIATWSLSEVPFDTRDRVLDLVSGADYCLIAYQGQFRNLNNLNYFAHLTDSRTDFDWAGYPIEHLPGNHYLIGRKKSLHITNPDNYESNTPHSAGLVNGVIFSKDRAMQLDATIRSFLLSCKDHHFVNLKVIYKASNSYHKESYDKLIRQYKSIEFIEEEDFRKQLLSNLAHSKYVLFLVDDNIFVRDFHLSEIAEVLQKNSDALGFSLRLGKNINYHYPSSSKEMIPPFIDVTGKVLKYDWTGKNRYFGYPLEVSSSVYRTDDVLPLLTKLDFQGPNTLEAEIARSKNTFANSKKNLLCFQQSVTFCNPVNVVQDVFPDNRSGNKREYSPDSLARMFNAGYRIDVAKFLNFIPSSCHQEVQFEFIKSNSESSGPGYNCPTVSIYMAVYNSEKYLAQTLDSILSQTFIDFEIVIADDGSMDNSAEILKRYEKADNRIRVLQLPHVGVVEARNEAIKRCNPNSKYLLNHDSDDMSSPTKLARLVEYLETHPEIAIVGCFAEYFDDEGNFKGQPPIEWLPERIRQTFGEVNSMIHSASLIRRQVFEKIGSYSKDFPVTQDYDFFARALMAGFELANIPEVLHKIRLHPKSIGNAHAASVKIATDRVQKNYKSHQQKERASDKPRLIKGGLKLNNALSILHTVELYGPHVGGAELVVQQLSERLAKRGHNVTVATTRLAERTFDQLNGVQIEEFDVQGAIARGFTGSDIAHYQQFLLKHPADIMMNYAAQQWATDLAFDTLASTSNRRVNIIAPCGYSALSDSKTLQMPQFADYFNKVIPTYLPKYDAAVYNSQRYQDYQFAQNHGFANSVIIPNGVGEEEFSQAPKVNFRQKYNITTRYMGLCVAGFYPGKGQDRVIDCVRQMNRPDFTMVFIGKEGNLLAKLKEKSKRLNVKFMVGIPREDILAAYHQADIFLFGSEKECSPLVIIEAKASHTPFVSTDCGNIREWKGGVVCAPEKMAVYANRILDEEIIHRSFAEDGWKEWKEKLTWETIVDKYENLYSRLHFQKKFRKVDIGAKDNSVTQTAKQLQEALNAKQAAGAKGFV